MTRAEYRDLRSHARDKWRTAEIFDAQTYVGPTGGMRSADIAHSQLLTKNAQYAESLVPGGLTRPYRYHGTCLLAEWQERRQRVHAAIANRHRAERARMRLAA